MRGSKAKRLHFLRDQLATANLRPPAKARRMPAWLARYQLRTGPSVAASPTAAPHRRAPRPDPRPRQGGLKAKGRTAGPSEKTLARQQRRQHSRRGAPAFIDHAAGVGPARTVETAEGVL